MYLVKALVGARAPDLTGNDVDWAAGQTGLVADKDYSKFSNNPAAWTILAGPGMAEVLTALAQQASAIAPGDAPATAGITASNNGAGEVYRTVLNLDGMEISVADADAFGSTQLYGFPEGRILVLGAVGALQFAVTTARETTINADASLTWSLGTEAASAAILADAMVDLLPKTVKVLDGVDDALTTASPAVLAASAQFDGTTTAIDAFLNVGFETGTDIDADGTLAVTGSITICWMYLGDV